MINYKIFERSSLTISSAFENDMDTSKKINGQSLLLKLDEPIILKNHLLIIFWSAYICYYVLVFGGHFKKH